MEVKAAKEFASRYGHARIVALSEIVGIERATSDVLGALREVVTSELTVAAPRN
jgi:hypothetical protein